MSKDKPFTVGLIRQIGDKRTTPLAPFTINAVPPGVSNPLPNIAIMHVNRDIHSIPVTEAALKEFHGQNGRLPRDGELIEFGFGLLKEETGLPQDGMAVNRINFIPA